MSDTQDLAGFLAGLRYADLPQSVLLRSEELFLDWLGRRWALRETSFKFHASCRHIHPAADALREVLQREGLEYRQIARVLTRVHQGDALIRRVWALRDAADLNSLL